MFTTGNQHRAVERLEPHLTEQIATHAGFTKWVSEFFRMLPDLVASELVIFGAGVVRFCDSAVLFVVPIPQHKLLRCIISNATIALGFYTSLFLELVMNLFVKRLTHY
ncbi:hypothetical protein D3C87_1419430 [compost metagenome]